MGPLYAPGMRPQLALAFTLLAPACATPVASTARSLPRDFSDAAQPATVAKPQTPAEAASLVAEAVDLLQRHEPGALPRFEALLRCDFLTERGRANLYWLAAEAARGVDDARHRDHLAGYLVAVSVVPADFKSQEKTRKARALLLVDKVQSSQLGDSPSRAIVVGDSGEADLVVSQLGCGARGESPYIERHGLVTTGSTRQQDAPSPRRLLCTENGDELVLWFQIGD